ncbi:MAG: MG2 domain-containing protein, partial [Ginsengibacter sp.]
MSRCRSIRTALLSLLLIIATMAAAQLPNNNNQWKNIDALVTKGLNKSALDQIKNIYTSAKKTGNNTQVIKALLYQLRLQQNLEEDADIKGIQLLEQEIKQTNGPAKSILHSIAAEQYFNYYQQNRWKLYERPTVENFPGNDITNWSTDQLHKKIGGHYLASIADEKGLQRININSYNDVLVKGNTDQLRPTLYDLLANRAINYFNNDERDIQRPAYAFELDDDAVFDPATQFISHTFKTEDSASLHFKALEIFQKLLKFHLHDTNAEAFINVDIERLQFAETYFIGENKTALFLHSLQIIFNRNTGNSGAQAGYLIAQKIYDQAHSYPRDSSSFYTSAKAKAVADSVIKRNQKSEGGINAANLVKTITQPALHLETEKINVPGKSFRTLVSYQNISSINLRITSVTPAMKVKMRAAGDRIKLWAILLNENPLKTWQQTLPLPNDFEYHSTEIKIDQLPIGEYFLLASVSNDFDLNKNTLALQPFHVSNISFVNNNSEYFVLHRETGQPLKDAVVQVWKEVYDKNETENLIKQEKIIANKNGYFKLREPLKDENRNIHLEISTNDDHLFLEETQYNNSYYDRNGEGNDNDSLTVSNYERDQARVYLFTDRSIYRPGQLVYFKGIAITNDVKTKRSKIFRYKDSVKVILRDANGEIDSMLLKLNDFGSVSGNFKLPEGRMNAYFVIEAMHFGNSTVSFAVEEYKRPKFYAELEKLKDSYRLNDSITVKGAAKGYAGNNINNATVSYSVRRVARFIYPWLFWRWPMPLTRPLEITHGIIKTGDDGNFSLTFKSIPDLSINKKTEPVFDYEINVDVTDAAGETRSATTVISIGYKSLDVKIKLPANEVISTDSLKAISVTAQNLAGEKVPAVINVKVIKLLAPTRLIRKRYWSKPDQFVMSKEDYSKHFPLDDYANELEKESWAKGD